MKKILASLEIDREEDRMEEGHGHSHASGGGGEQQSQQHPGPPLHAHVVEGLRRRKQAAVERGLIAFDGYR